MVNISKMSEEGKHDPNPFEHLKDYELRRLAFQCLRLRILLNSQFVRKNKSWEFNIGWALNSDFKPHPIKYTLAIIAEDQYWLPTIEDIKLIFEELKIELGYGETSGGTYTAHVSYFDEEAGAWEQEKMPSGYFKEDAYLQALLRYVSDHPGKVEETIKSIVNKSRAKEEKADSL